jgi:hypothetical protein
MCININYSKGPVSFLTDFNFYCSPIIVNQIIVIKEIVPVLAPTFSVETPELKKPTLHGRVHQGVVANGACTAFWKKLK